MKEDFLHYLWKFKKFDHRHLETSSGFSVSIHSPGMHNHHAGPDFFNSRLCIASQEWAGNVELHVRSSHWYMHGHEQDPAYDNVILHVVWEDDVDVYGKNDKAIPTLVLKDYVDDQMLIQYRKLFDNRGTHFINCEKDFSSVPASLVYDWLERLYLERLERKVQEIRELLKATRGDWEAVLFRMLARNFGTRINGESFSLLAKNTPFTIVRKARQREGVLEALLLGQAGLLTQSEDTQVKFWKSEYEFLQSKFHLNPYQGAPVQFFRLRPSNFPGLRLAQLARLYENHEYLFQKVMQTRDLSALRCLFQLKASSYWDTHYNFNKKHKKKPKKLSTKFVDLLIINTLIPLKFAYMETKPDSDPSQLLDLISEIPAENNQIVNTYYQLRELPKNALNSQALVQLNTMYCKPNKCLNCRIGDYLIGNKQVS